MGDGRLLIRSANEFIGGGFTGYNIPQNKLLPVETFTAETLFQYRSGLSVWAEGKAVLSLMSTKSFP